MKLYGLIGYPLGHSFSKQYFTEKFSKEGLTDCFFESFPIETINEFKKLLLDNPSLLGLGVTIPYKEQVLQFVDELSPEVKIIGAANSIKISGNYLTAYNTDIIGFEKSFCRELKPFHNKALILGTGGASKAIQFVLKKLAIDFLVVTRVNNNNSNMVAYNEVDEKMIIKYNIIINCTPAGMSPNNNSFPDLPYQFITNQHYLYDLVYKPANTLFMQKGAAGGAIAINGHEMLLIQAEASWKIWNNL